jgi:2-keto-4-pentenoate hydratase/2-oxohepta-3-ene-1,7-dioic acid hydratase in catechol pathway
VLGSAVFPFPSDFHFERSAVAETVTSFPLDEVKLLAPVVPSKIVCVGRNYREHAAERRQP